MNNVIFSIESSDLSRNCDILKIVLLDTEDNTKVWIQNLQPTKSKELHANELVQNEDSYSRISAIHPREGMKSFVSYLEQIYPNGVNLVAHNGYKFEFPHLKRYLEKYLPSYGKTYSMKWVDSIKIFRKHFPGLDSYNKPFLDERFASIDSLELSGDAFLHCQTIKRIIECASKEKQMSITQFVGTSSLPFSFISSPYVEKKVIFDLETTGFGRDCEILQMALVDINDNSKSWNQYIQPQGLIDSKATEVNHLSLGIDNKLCYRGFECKDVVKPFEGILRFKTYLKYNYPDGAILIAHNGDTFDFPLLKRYLEKYDEEFLKENDNYVITCIDSLGAFKKHFRGFSSYKQDNLIKRFSAPKSLEGAHDALVDCINLRNTIERAALEMKLSVAQFLGESSNKQSLSSF